jgi:predicted RNA-binding Zn ribbon-like protein
MKKRPPKHPFDLTSGRVCLDFVNTVDNRLSSQPQERLTGFAELVAFGEQAGALSASEARKLRRDGRENTRAASALFQRSVAVREMMFRILSAVTAHHQVSEVDVEAFNAVVRRSNACSLVTPGDGKAAWQWLDKSGDADRLIGKIVRSAVELLTSDDIQCVKRCAAEDCDWLFMDDSRSRNRRWCEMRTCGSRQKARAYYQRKKADRQHMSGRTHSDG